MPESINKERRNAKYNAKCDNINLRPLLDVGAGIRAAADQAGQSLQGYILDAVRQRMARDAGQAVPDSRGQAGRREPVYIRVDPDGGVKVVRGPIEDQGQGQDQGDKV